MIFDELRAFLVVARQGSFLAAAVTLGVSRTTLRRQVDALEAEAGVALLRRARTGVELTDAGRQLLARGEVLDQEFGALLHAIRETHSHPEGEVRLLLPVGLPPELLSAIFAMFRAAWPAVTVRSRYHEDPLATNLSEVDLVVWFGDASPRGAWEVHTVHAMRCRLLASRTYLAARGTPRSLADLAAHDLLAWSAPGEDRARLTLRSGVLHAITPVLTCTSVHELHECAQLGLGIAWVPDGGVPLPPGREPLVRVLEEIVGAPLELRLAVPRALADVPKVRVFIDAIASLRAFLPQGEPDEAPAKKTEARAARRR